MVHIEEREGAEMSNFNDNVFSQEDRGDDGRKSCNSKSACVLKDIIDDLGELNNRDLRTLDEIIDRILECNSNHR